MYFPTLKVFLESGIQLVNILRYTQMYFWVSIVITFFPLSFNRLVQKNQLNMCQYTMLKNLKKYLN